MSHTMPKSNGSQEVTSFDGVRPRMAKAVTPNHTVLRRVIAGVIDRMGNKKATAADMGIDRAQLYRQIDNGHLTIERLEALGPEFGVALGQELLEHYGPLATPHARAKQKVRDLRATADELDQLLEFIA